MEYFKDGGAAECPPSAAYCKPIILFEKMTQNQRREYLIKALLKEHPENLKIKIPSGEQEQKALLRSLFNIRMPLPAAEELLTIQDAYLREETHQKGITIAEHLAAHAAGIISLAGRYYFA